MPVGRPHSAAARIVALAHEFPGDPMALTPRDDLGLDAKKLAALGQTHTYRTDGSSTALAVGAVKALLAETGVAPQDVGLVVAAPTLLTGYGFEVPPVAIAAECGLGGVETANFSQGCVGFLAGLRHAGWWLRDQPAGAKAVVVTMCKASSLTDGLTHGGFFWSDGAAAALVARDDAAAGPATWGYAEALATADWGAMRLPFGDAHAIDGYGTPDDFRIQVRFDDERAQMNYIVGEQARCAQVIDTLLADAGLTPGDVEAVIIPSVGRNRVKMLFSGHKELVDRIVTDFSLAHAGGVDLPVFLQAYLQDRRPGGSGWIVMLSPAFTAQWAGLLLRC